MTRTLLVCFFALYGIVAQARNVVVTVVQPAAAGSIELIATTKAENFSTRSPTITYPSLQSGDILIAVFVSSNAHDANGTPPTGWTLIQQSVSAGAAMTVFWRRADGTESGSLTFTNLLADTEVSVSVCSSFRGCASAGSPIDASAQETSAASTDKDISLTTTVGNTMLVAYIGTAINSTADRFAWDSPIVEFLDIDTTPAGNYSGNAGVFAGYVVAATSGTKSVGGDMNTSIAAAEIVIALKK